VETEWVFRNLDSDYKVIIVGDAAMAPEELYSKTGNYRGPNGGLSGMEWLTLMKSHFKKIVWMNPKMAPGNAPWREAETAIKEMFCIINGGEQEQETQEYKPQLMDWEHDFSQIAPPVSRVLGYDVRMPDKYTHWYSFLGAYMEIGDCAFSTIVSIRSKRAKGKKLEKWEEEYLCEHRKMVEIPRKLTAEEQEFLDSDW
jgi:hypothetical protein